MLDSMLRNQYARDCVQSPTRKSETEYWYQLDGTSTGVKATCIEDGEPDCKRERPSDGAYAATLKIGSYCADSPAAKETLAKVGLRTYETSLAATTMYTTASNQPSQRGYGDMIAVTLRKELGASHQTIKTLMRWTGASGILPN